MSAKVDKRDSNEINGNLSMCPFSKAVQYVQYSDFAMKKDVPL